MNNISKQLKLPVSPHWNWEWRICEDSPEVELIGIFKTNKDYMIRTKIRLSSIVANNPSVGILIDRIVAKAEGQSLIIDTPLHKAMRESNGR